MWNAISRLFSHHQEPAEKLLAHFDRLAGSEPKFVKVSDAGVQPSIFVAIYRGYPEANAITGFTLGLSHFHPPDGGHKELVISMRDSDDSWALACGYLAYQLRDRCPFICGDTLDFGEQVNNSTGMSAFLATHPRQIPAAQTVVDLRVRQVQVVELVPIYAEELEWIRSGGSVESFLHNCPPALAMNPKRKAFVNQ